MNNRKNFSRIAALGAAVALTVAACGSDDAEVPVDDDTVTTEVTEVVPADDDTVTTEVMEEAPTTDG